MMSNPATQHSTAAPSRTGGQAMPPVTAIQAPTGAIASDSPSAICEAHRKRFVYE
jgi:hypothetical protein